MRERRGRRGKTAGGGVVDSAGEELEVGGDLTSGSGCQRLERERRETERAACRSWASGAIWVAWGTAGRKKDDGPAGKEEGKLGLGAKGKGWRVGEGFIF
jgi:hypothetical protein